MVPEAGPPTSLARSATLVAAVVTAFVVATFVVWHAASALLLIFAGIVFAVALDAGARALGRVIGGGRRFRLVLTALVLVLVVGGALAWSGASLAQQAGSLVSTLGEQVTRLMDLLGRIGLRPSENGGAGEPMQGLLPSARALFGGATNALFATFGAVGNIALVLFLAIFFAWDPGIYRTALVSLLPRDRRERVADVLDESVASLRRWLTGQAISMLVIFLLTYVLLLLVGMPFALMLALQAGLLEFIPTLGPIMAGLAIVLVGLSHSPEMAAWGLAIYLLIQGVESNVLNPIVQRHTTRIPPAFSLGMQLLLGALFGVLGVALAVPIAAAGMILVRELYIRDALGGEWEERAAATSEKR
ncbi:AI-2E family transporter [Faunimonas sp. B44]|uniref:AI-2E family transporter n=1 Tax=Faunimonas sp. B44 TaxID=3461493 RepID=UPI00404426FA